MNKSRVETISDGVFAIVMTLLVFDIKVPSADIISSADLWGALATLWPLFLSYAFSFLVLSVFWINHHFLFHSFTRAVNRQLNLLNMVYLLFLAFVPFSAHLLGTFYTHQAAVVVYGLNILAVVMTSTAMMVYIRARPELRNEDLSRRTVKQSWFRVWLSILLYVCGLLVSFISTPLSICFYLFPMFFNIIPGTLDFFERIFRFKLA